MSTTQILVVEDERLVAKALQNELEQFGYSVSGIASSASEAVTQVEEHRPDLVLMDIHLKGEADGIEAAERIQSRSGVPVIYLSAFSDARDGGPRQRDQCVRLFDQALRRAGAADDDRNGARQASGRRAAGRVAALAGGDSQRHRRRRGRHRSGEQRSLDQLCRRNADRLADGGRDRRSGDGGLQSARRERANRARGFRGSGRVRKPSDRATGYDAACVARWPRNAG